MAMISPIDSLSFSLQSNKGVYALLLGSGISRAAQIPTGWEITLDLVRKLAALEGANCEPSPEAWFSETRGEEPNYSKLLHALARTPSARQQLLRPYWEPTESERENGAKKPTNAHRAIAKLVKAGYVRVIVTTNFDRLMELALEEHGIVPTVISNSDAIKGAMPLVHAKCTIFKVHGDYLDTRIRNTPEELASYPRPINVLLDKIFDDFGLIVIGWSAEWDEALRAAILRAPNRRFPMHWVARGALSEAAKILVQSRSASVIEISGADAFFESLAEKVLALDEFSRPHPLSTEASVALLKKYVVEEKYRIQLHDLVDSQANTYQEFLRQMNFNLGEGLTGEALDRRMLAMERGGESLSKLAFAAGRWSNSSQVSDWVRALSRLCDFERQSGLQMWLELRSYPASLIFYSFVLGAVLGLNFASIKAILDGKIPVGDGEEAPISQRLPLLALLRTSQDAIKLVRRSPAGFTPWSDRVFAVMQEMHSKSFISLDDLEERWNFTEMLLALAFGVSRANEGPERYWAPYGRFIWNQKGAAKAHATFESALLPNSDAQMEALLKILGKSPELARRNLDGLNNFVARLRFSLNIF